MIDASFAWLAELHQAGRIGGAVDTMEYLVANVGLPRSEALSRPRQGRALHDPVADPEPERLSREAAERRRAAVEEKARREARTREASADRRTATETELKELFAHAVRGINALRTQALAGADK